MVALVLDLTKAYQSVRTSGDLERNVRRLVWRFGETEAAWQFFRWQVMTFGDQLASLILELVKNRAAEMGMEVDAEAANLLKRAMYVDDLLGGGTWEQVARFRGERLSSGAYNGTLAQILSKVGFTSKLMVVSVECNPEVLEQFGGKVLGHAWCPRTDKIEFKVTVNLSGRNRKGE